MKIKDVTEVGLLLAVGFVLHSIFPPILFGMKPDFTLAMLFAIILLKGDFKLALLAGVTTGVFTALTTAFPGGQIANLVDKTLVTLILTPIVVHFQLFQQTPPILVGVVNFVGTLLSGVIFLGTAATLFGLPGSIITLILTVVLPAAIINTLAGVILFSAILQSKQYISRA